MCIVYGGVELWHGEEMMICGSINIEGVHYNLVVKCELTHTLNTHTHGSASTRGTGVMTSSSKLYCSGSETSITISFNQCNQFQCVEALPKRVLTKTYIPGD